MSDAPGEKSLLGFRLPPPDAPPAATVRGRDLAIAAILPCLLVLPFLNKAYHIDDPLFVWTAQHILEDPLRFYGFDVNWKHTAEPMYRVMQNPPLLSYWLAPFGALFGFGEPVMHLAMLPWTALAGAAFYLLAARFTTRPLFAALLALLSPGFLVSATQVMSDVPMVGLWALAAWAWLRGLERNTPAWCALSATLILLATLTKYFAAALIPLLLVYTLLQGPSRWRLLAWFAIPAIGLVLYEFACYRIYGIGLLADAGRFAATFRHEDDISRAGKIYNTLTFTGGCLAPVFFAALLMWPRRVLALLAALVFAASLASYCFPNYFMLDVYLVWDETIIQHGIFQRPLIQVGFLRHLQWGLWLTAGLHLFGLALWLAWRKRNPQALFLLLWIAGTAVFVAFINHFVNARVVLPMALPAAIFAAWQLTPPRVSSRAPKILLGACALSALLVAYADYTLAGSQRQAARAITEEFREPGRDIWFSGHYGWQYYMLQAGARSADPALPPPKSGDVFVVPANNAWPVFPPSERIGRTEQRYFRTFPLVVTVQHYHNAGFYADAAGPLPFTVSWAGSEEYGIVHLQN